MAEILLNAVGVGGGCRDSGGDSSHHLVVAMTRIYWLSRHTPLPAQLEELARIFGEMAIVEDRRPFGTAEEMLGRYTASGCTEMVVVVPESVLRRLIEVGLKPLRAKMVEVRELTDPDRETTAKHQVWRFEYFERVLRYEFLTERLRVE